MPYLNPFREDRLRRMQEICAEIKARGTVKLDELLGWGGINWGSTEESIMRMLRQLEKAHLIKIDDKESTVQYVEGTETETSTS